MRWVAQGHWRAAITVCRSTFSLLSVTNAHIKLVVHTQYTLHPIAGTHVALLSRAPNQDVQQMKTILAATCLALGATAANAEVFKCGKSFQDHPCQTAAPAKAQSKTGKTSTRSIIIAAINIRLPRRRRSRQRQVLRRRRARSRRRAPKPTPTPRPNADTDPEAYADAEPCTGTGSGSRADTGSDADPDAGTATPTPTGPAGAAGCGLASAAFCETFETPAPGGNGGDLDETKWAVSRWGIGYNHGQTFYRPVASTQSGYDVSATFCGAPFSNIAVLQDFKFCNGVDGKGVASKQLHEVIQDGGDNIYVNSMMTRQPFDFAGRTGTIVWDVDAKIFPRNDGHGWWTEMWISEDPGPLPYQQNFPSVDSVARNSFGLVFQGTNYWEGCNKAKMMNGVTAAIVSNNYNTRDLISFTDMFKAPYNCFKVADSKLNHFELRINTDTAELYASDAGVPSSLRLVFRVSGLQPQLYARLRLVPAHALQREQEPGWVERQGYDAEPDIPLGQHRFRRARSQRAQRIRRSAARQSCQWRERVRRFRSRRRPA